MAKEIPMKQRELLWISQHANSTVDDVMEALKDEYGNEGQFKRKVFDQHLAVMRATGLLKVTEESLDNAGNLVVKYAITNYGRSEMRFILA